MTAGQPTSPPTEGKLEEVEEETSNSAEGETGYLHLRCTPGPLLSVSRHFPLYAQPPLRGVMSLSLPLLCASEETGAQGAEVASELTGGWTDSKAAMTDGCAHGLLQV